ncbi:MAG: DinB family protein [Acidobacteria bacterium]|nr:DinB family protein [Acidobacteriota bacterium]
MSSKPEAWLRGPVPGIPDLLQPVAHALIAAAEDVAAPVAGLSDAQLWLQPGGAASVAFHLQHLAGSTDRLLTYARGEGLSDVQKAALAAERTPPDPRPGAAELLDAWQAAVNRAMRQLGGTRDAELRTPRLIGRAQLPATTLGLLVHAAEHATRHVGQIITTARIVAGLGL